MCVCVCVCVCTIYDSVDTKASNNVDSAKLSKFSYLCSIIDIEHFYKYNNFKNMATNLYIYIYIYIYIYTIYILAMRGFALMKLK